MATIATIVVCHNNCAVVHSIPLDGVKCHLANIGVTLGNNFTPEYSFS